MSSLCEQPFPAGMSLCSPCRALSLQFQAVRGAPAHGGEEHVRRKTLSLVCTSWQSWGTLLSLPSDQQPAGSLALPGRGRDAEGGRAARSLRRAHGAQQSSSSSKWVKSILLLTRLQVSDCSSLIQRDRIDVPPLPIDAVKESPRLLPLPSYSDSPDCPCRTGSLFPPGTPWRCS